MEEGPEMEQKYEEAQEAMRAFIREFAVGGPSRDFVVGWAITARFTAEYLKERVGGFDVEACEAARNKLRQRGEDPDELVLQVFLREPLPENMHLPETYNGFKVFACVAGEPISHIAWMFWLQQLQRP